MSFFSLDIFIFPWPGMFWHYEGDFYDEIVSAILCASWSSKCKKPNCQWKFALFCYFYIVFQIKQNHSFRVNIVILAPKVILRLLWKYKVRLILYSKTTNSVLFCQLFNPVGNKRRNLTLIEDHYFFPGSRTNFQP